MYREQLKQRAEALAKARAFFEKRDVIEVDTPSLQRKAQIDNNIDVIQASVTEKETGFLHTSPEYAMKKLLAKGSKDIYYLGHVFRKGEVGRRHNPEFTMAEWYRLSFSLEEMMKETLAFLSLFLPSLPSEIFSYRDVFKKFTNLDYKKDSLDHLIPEEGKNWERQTKLHFILSDKIEPHLGIDKFTVLTDYPPNEAALAQTKEKNGELVSERFEIYHQGVELANGYHELTSSQELKKRFETENLARIKRGQAPIELDQEFLEEVEKLPPCSGVSVGFDRAFMLQQKSSSLSEILPFSW